MSTSRLSHCFRSQHKVIVGVDYGTTFTGVSYVLSTRKNLEDIHIIRTWPGPGRELDAMWKTPSRLAYASENANIGFENQWGYQVTAKMKSYCWTKLLLDSKAPITEYDDPDLQKAQGGGLLRLPKQCTATEVCADYLREIYNYTLDYITRRLGDAFLAVTPLEFWFTVPAIWSHQAKYATLTAARRAGFGSRQADDIYLIPEPEAAAVATLSSWSHHGDVVVKCGDGIMICDCGGGTVDITTYAVTNANPLQFEEVIAGIGGKCGSTYIDRNFHVWMSSQFGSAFECLGQDKTGVGSRFMKDFESSKWDFGIESDINKHFEIEITMRGVQSSKYYDADDSTVIFSRKEMASFFDPPLKMIISLIDQQIKDAQHRSPKTRITKLVLVGGFGDSPYLNKRVKEWCESNGNIHCLCPDYPQAAIVKGAALRGLQGLKASKKRSRHHYGIALSSRFRKGIDPEDLSYISLWTESKNCKKRMKWSITKGQLIDETTKITHGVSRTLEGDDDYCGTVKLYSCSLDKAPDYARDEGVQLVGCVEITLSANDIKQFKSKFIDGVKNWRVQYEIHTYLAPQEGVLHFEVTMGKKEIGSAQIDYKYDL